MWLICFVISVLCLIVSIVFFLAFNKFVFTKNRKIRRVHLSLVGVFISALFMFFPIHSVTSNATALGYVRNVLLSFFNSMQIFALGCEFNVVSDGIMFCPVQLETSYQVLAATLFALAPIFTFGFVLSFFENVYANFKCRLSRKKNAFVFSELNEKALALARDIAAKNANILIVFTDVFERNEERSCELIESAKKLRAICFKKDIAALDFSRHSKKKSISFFAIGIDETENLNQALSLIEQYRNREKTHVYVFSTQIKSELLLPTVAKGLVKVRRVNEVQSLINRILYERGEVLFESARETAEGYKKISAVVVGIGRYGTEMLKALAWFGQMDGYKLEINAFDLAPLAEERFTAMAPELMSPQYNGVEVQGEAQYKITIHSGFDVDSITFVKEISKIADASYVFVALGDDDVNIKAAINLRMHFERLGIHPVIQTIIYNSQEKRALEGIKNYKGQKYDIEFIGDIDSSYTQDVIIDSELEEDALNRHKKYGKEEEFWEHEYNYRSSVACAIHMKARIKCCIPGADKNAESLSEKEEHIIASLEHRRWNAYMRAEGYVFSGSTDSSSRNCLAKMHHDLVDYSSLSEEEKCKDRKLGPQ